MVISSAEGKVLESLQLVPATDVHRSFILATWVRSYEAHVRKLTVCGMRVEPEVYREGERRVSEAVWSNSECAVGEDGFTIHAWVCAKPGALWHVYVPPQLRGIGCATALASHTAGDTYGVYKPWPWTAPRTHKVTFDPWMTL